MFICIKIIITFCIILLFCNSANSFGEQNTFFDKFNNNKHLFKEQDYQHKWCSQNKGIEEYKNSDNTRVDCLTDTNAVEFDFAEKWAESIGQALHYSYLTGKKAKVILILEKPDKQMKYFERTKTLGKIYNFEVEYITADFLKIIE